MRVGNGVVLVIVFVCVVVVVCYRHVLVCIWGKILAFDISCQADLVKDQACPNFISHLSWGLKNDMGEEKLLTEEKYSSYENSEEDALEQRMMAAFILSTICMDFCPGQNECLRLNTTLSIKFVIVID